MNTKDAIRTLANDMGQPINNLMTMDLFLLRAMGHLIGEYITERTEDPEDDVVNEVMDVITAREGETE